MPTISQLAGNLLLNPVNFTVEARTKILADPLRNWNFQLIVPNIVRVAPISSIPLFFENLIVNCESVTLPVIKTEMIKTEYLGQEQYFTGKKRTAGTFSCVFYEREDQQMVRMFYEWMMNGVNHDVDGSHVNTTKHKSDVATDIFVQMFSMAKIPLPYSYKMFNCQCSNIDSVSLNWGGSEIVRQNITFTYDYAKLVLAGSSKDYTVNPFEDVNKIASNVVSNVPKPTIASVAPVNVPNPIV